MPPQSRKAQKKADHNPIMAKPQPADHGTVNALPYRIRSIRRQKSLTLADIATKAGLDKGYLSRIERNEKSPSIATLIKIAEALGVQLSELFGETVAHDAVTVIRRQDHKPFPLFGKADEHSFKAILPGNPQSRLAFFIVHPGDDPDLEPADHSGEELIYVLRGRVEISFVDRSITLDEGDCVHFDGHIRHRIRRLGRTRSELLLVIAQDLGDRVRK